MAPFSITYKSIIRSFSNNEENITTVAAPAPVFGPAPRTTFHALTVRHGSHRVMIRTLHGCGLTGERGVRAVSNR